MRKLLFACVAVLGLVNVTAQEKETVGGFEKKDIYISGTVGFSNNSNSGSDVSFTNYVISPSVGYFVTENIAVELGLTIGSEERFDGFIGDVVDTNTFGVNLNGIYFFTPSNQFSFVVGAGISYATIGEENTPDTNAFAIAVAPGVNYFVSESFALRASVGSLSYSNSKVEGASNSTSNFGLNLNLASINLGLTYKF